MSTFSGLETSLRIQRSTGLSECLVVMAEAKLVFIIATYIVTFIITPSTRNVDHRCDALNCRND